MTPPDFPFPRVSEQTALSLKGVRASVMRLPQVHDPVKQGLITPAIEVYREKGVCAYVGDGLNRWPAAYVLDVNASLQVDAEEGVSMRDIAEATGRRLELPVKSIGSACLRHTICPRPARRRGSNSDGNRLDLG